MCNTVPAYLIALIHEPMVIKKSDFTRFSQWMKLFPCAKATEKATFPREAAVYYSAKGTLEVAVKQ